jgi:hypothetical protein
MPHTDLDPAFTMGPLGTVNDCRYVIAVIQTLRYAMRAIDNGKLTDLTVLVDAADGAADSGDAKHAVLRNAIAYSGLQHRHTYTLSEYIYVVFLGAGAPTQKASDGVEEIDMAALAALSTRGAKDLVREALYSLGDVIKFNDNFYRMA